MVITEEQNTTVKLSNVSNVSNIPTHAIHRPKLWSKSWYFYFIWPNFI